MSYTNINIMDTSGTAMENLYPALTECFAIIICGYFAGRMNLISETEAKGLNTFVGTFALPSLIFMSLAELDLSSVNWLFLLSILVAKAIVFFSVIIITLLVGRPIHLGRAGIFGIFCTQSNDFAIGYPIVVALYQQSHPEYPSYLYLMAPISLAILNPIAFVLLEISKQREQNELNNDLSINDLSESSNGSIRKEKLKLVGSVAKGIILNPIILMTLLGIIGNLIFNHHIPTYLGGILNVLGSAFSATALFLLGLRMVGKIHKLRGATLVVPGILIMVKLLALPLVTREVVSLIHPGGSVNETLDLSTYGFLYGTFPSAPTVFVFATQYNLDVDLIASAMVACTFISAPLMFVSAKMISITKLQPSDYIVELDNFAFTVSIAGVIACIWVIITFTITKKIKRVPHKITSFLVVSQFLSCVGVILWSTLGQRQDWVGYLQFAIFTIGVYSSRLWTSFLAVGLLFMQCRSLCFVLKLEKVFIVLGWGIPILIATFLILFDKQNIMPSDKQNPNFQYGFAQALIAVCLLILCFIVTVGCLILHQRHRKRYRQYLNMARDVSTNRPSINSDTEVSDTESIHSHTDRLLPENVVNAVNQKNNHKCGNLPTINEGCCEEMQSPVVDIEDLMGPSNSSSKILRSVTPQPDDVLHPTPGGLCPTRFGCQGPSREQCQGILQRYQDQQNADSDVETLEEDMDSHDPQTLRHIVLLILLLCSMFVGLAISVWTLVMEEMSGIYIELAFLDSTLNFGQSLIVFTIFGVETKEILLPLLKHWRKLWYGANFLVLPAWDELSNETRHICDQFVTHHLANCKRAIAKDTRWRIKIYRNVFSGTKFVDWLLDVGLARDRIEAVNYARHLIEGKVLKHINNVHHFYDRNLLYTFV